MLNFEEMLNETRKVNEMEDGRAEHTFDTGISVELKPDEKGKSLLTKWLDLIDDPEAVLPELIEYVLIDAGQQYLEDDDGKMGRSYKENMAVLIKALVDKFGKEEILSELGNRIRVGEDIFSEEELGFWADALEVPPEFLRYKGEK